MRAVGLILMATLILGAPTAQATLSAIAIADCAIFLRECAN